MWIHVLRPEWSIKYCVFFEILIPLYLILFSLISNFFAFGNLHCRTAYFTREQVAFASKLHTYRWSWRNGVRGLRRRELRCSRLSSQKRSPQGTRGSNRNEFWPRTFRSTPLLVFGWSLPQGEFATLRVLIDRYHKHFCRDPKGFLFTSSHSSHWSQ